MTAPTVLTFGHGTATQEEIVALLRGACVELVVDVRRFPGSRRHPPGGCGPRLTGGLRHTNWCL